MKPTTKITSYIIVILYCDTLSTSYRSTYLLIIAYNVAKANSSSPSASRVNLTLTSSNGKEPEIETPIEVINKIEGVEKNNNNNNNNNKQPNFKELVKIPIPNKFYKERKLLDDYII